MHQQARFFPRKQGSWLRSWDYSISQAPYFPRTCSRSPSGPTLKGKDSAVKGHLVSSSLQVVPDQPAMARMADPPHERWWQRKGHRSDVWKLLALVQWMAGVSLTLTLCSVTTNRCSSYSE